MLAIEACRVTWCGHQSHAPKLVRAPLARVEVLRADDGHDAASGVQARRLDVEGEHFARNLGRCFKQLVFFASHRRNTGGTLLYLHRNDALKIGSSSSQRTLIQRPTSGPSALNNAEDTQHAFNKLY